MTDKSQVYKSASVSLTAKRQYGFKTILKKKSKNKDPIIIFALIVQDVEDGKVTFCSFPFVWEIKYKEVICRPFSYQTKSCFHGRNSLSFRKEFIPLIQSMKRQAVGKERPSLFFE